MSDRSESAHEAPTSVSLGELIALKPAGEMIKLSTPRIRAVAAGGHLSPFKGRGVEFDESRPYQEGDDLRTIDWRVTARTGKPHTKVFREERNRPVILWLDLRASMMFATRGAFKSVVAARSAALIAWSAIANGDQLGGLVFSESGHEELRPRLGHRAALRLLQLIAADPAWRGADDAADVVQTTFLKAFENLHRYDPQYKFFSWIYRIAVNESINHNKRRYRMHPLDERDIPDHHGPLVSTETESLNRQIEEGLMELDEIYRVVVVLRHYSEFSYREIGEVAQTSVGNVGFHLAEKRLPVGPEPVEGHG